MSEFFKFADLEKSIGMAHKIVVDKHLHYMIVVDTPDGTETFRGSNLTQLKETLATLEPIEVRQIVLF